MLPKTYVYLEPLLLIKDVSTMIQTHKLDRDIFLQYLVMVSDPGVPSRQYALRNSELLTYTIKDLLTLGEILVYLIQSVTYPPFSIN